MPAEVAPESATQPVEIQAHFPGRLHICRPTGGDAERVLLTLTDERSRTQTLEIEVGLAEFANALVGQREVECVIFPLNLCLVGMRSEQQNISFPMPNLFSDRVKAMQDAEAHINEALAKGWSLSSSELLNRCGRSSVTPIYVTVRATRYRNAEGQVVHPLTGIPLDPQPE